MKTADLLKNAHMPDKLQIPADEEFCEFLRKQLEKEKMITTSDIPENYTNGESYLYVD